MNKSRHGRARRSLLSIAVSMPKKTTLPIPGNSWGNILTRAIARFSPDDDVYDRCNLQLRDLAGKVHHAIESTDTDSYNSSSLCRFPVYEADHGWGKPCWVNIPMSQKLRNVIFLMDTFDGDGVEALVTLDQSGMHIFEQDPQIIPFLG
ncbi:hypothetical protein Tsubulata_000696 [Turnera subulata]|uniref:Uncharacterized protein n=1 Tax=Turnera subulata TaxID=218843 RepID=A0A9Q0FGP6_9ROSI|nr:hypothetical protein Tsubulata_000696 [Turnera subulata]